MKKYLVVLLVSLSACATGVTPDRLITGSEARNFFSVSAPNSNKTVVFFKCGMYTQDNPMFGEQKHKRECWYTIDGKKYEVLARDSVAKLTLKPGHYTFGQPDDLFATIIPKKLELRAGETLLLSANWLHKVRFLGQQHIFTIAVERDDIAQKIRRLTPVQMRGTSP
jgi:hypothetical protein